MKHEIKTGNYAVMGAARQGKNMIFTFAAEKSSKCAVLLYEKNRQEIVERIEIPKDYCVGSLRSVCVLNLDYRNYDYNFEIDGEMKPDLYAKKIVGRENWYDLKRAKRGLAASIRSGFDFAPFLWRDEQRPEIKKQDMILYKLHVRGFTMDTKAKDKGTFAALKKKIPYLKGLGITSVELMPVYEFEEIFLKSKEELPDYVTWKKQHKNAKEKEKGIEKGIEKSEEQIERMNFWGYTRGNYFAPKASYAASEKASFELKSLIREFHNNGIECILEMFFPKEVDAIEILDALHYWVLEYHADGFHLQGENIPIAVISQDLLLKRTKLLYTWFDNDMISLEKNTEHLYFCNDEFMYPIRRMLCGREAEIYEFTNQLRKQKENAGFVNYICDNNGFSLADLFSYCEKHNEANGENNQDGREQNYSCNCGIEGKTRKKHIMDMRKKLMYNALASLYLAQGVPLLFSGDEFGNSQNGNNNAYCQDNEIGWINWKQKERNKDLLEFTKQMIRFRKEHPVVSAPKPMQMCDYKNVGFPDLSYHGEKAWLTGFEPDRQTVGILYSGSYAVEEGSMDENVYVAYNFHRIDKKLALPVQQKGRKWYRIMDTSKGKEAFLEEIPVKEKKQVSIAAQSIAVFVGR